MYQIVKQQQQKPMVNYRNKILKLSEGHGSNDYQIKILEMVEPFLDELRLPSVFFSLGTYHVWAFLRNRLIIERLF